VVVKLHDNFNSFTDTSIFEEKEAIDYDDRKIDCEGVPAIVSIDDEEVSIL
jgi:hypothetical protein